MGHRKLGAEVIASWLKLAAEFQTLGGGKYAAASYSKFTDCSGVCVCVFEINVLVL